MTLCIGLQCTEGSSWSAFSYLGPHGGPRGGGGLCRGEGGQAARHATLRQLPLSHAHSLCPPLTPFSRGEARYAAPRLLARTTAAGVPYPHETNPT